jgi:hypothetical protein
MGNASFNETNVVLNAFELMRNQLLSLDPLYAQSRTSSEDVLQMQMFAFKPTLQVYPAMHA